MPMGLVMPAGATEERETFAVFEGNAMVSMTCLCRLGNLPMLIPGVQVVVACPQCQAQYKILEVLYDAQHPENGVHARVGRRTKAQQSLVHG